MTEPSDADRARYAMRQSDWGPDVGQAYATLALAEAITNAARMLSHGMIEAARIRARGTGR